jgi:hypothetical protein
MRKPMSGYLLGLILSAVAAVITIVGVLSYLQRELIRCAMSLGCTDSNPIPVLLPMFGGYLLAAAVLAAVASIVFKSRLGVAFLVNVAPLMAIIALLFLWSAYGDYSSAFNRTRNTLRAISEAPAIHLGEPYVKKVESRGGGAILLLQVPFKVDRTIHSQSLNILVSSNDSSPDIRYSSKPRCNSCSGEPTYGFHIVDGEHTEPLPVYLTGSEIVSGQLQPGMEYYLLRELHFGYSLCRVSDYQDFDAKQLKVTLDVAAAKQRLWDW